MNKKAIVEERMFLWIFYILLIIIIVIMLYLRIQDATTDTGFNKRFLSRDIALTIDTLYAAPNNVNLEYKISNKPNFVVLVKDGKVEVNTAEDIGAKLGAGKFSFAEDLNIEKLDKQLSKISDELVLKFKKFENKIEIEVK